MVRRSRRSTLHERRGPKPEDRFDKLPDEIIVKILSLLTLKEAITTSLLSRRWEYLWTFISTSLCFDSGKLLCDMAFDNMSLKDEYNYQGNFVKRVDHVLNVHNVPVLDHFKVFFSMDEHRSSAVNSWIKFAMKKRVQSLEFNFSSFQYGCPSAQPFALVDVTKLNLTSDNRLKVLRLISVDVSEQVINHILNKCPLLEELCVVRSKAITNLTIHGTESLKLRHLVLYCKRLQNLEMYAPNLVSFSYSGATTEVSFRNTPLLSELFICHEYCKSFIMEAPKHMSYFSKLMKLTLVIPPEVLERVCYHYVFPKLNNLKQLELRVGLYRGYPLGWLTCFIEAAPVLSKFVMKLSFVSTAPRYVKEEAWRYETTGTEKYTHKWLQEIEFIGFVGHSTDFRLGVRLLEISGVLEKITIDTRHPGMMFAPDEHCRAFAKQLPSDGLLNLPVGTEKKAKKLRWYVPPGAHLEIIMDDAFLL